MFYIYVAIEDLIDGAGLLYGVSFDKDDVIDKIRMKYEKEFKPDVSSITHMITVYEFNSDNVRKLDNFKWEYGSKGKEVFIKYFGSGEEDYE